MTSGSGRSGKPRKSDSFPRDHLIPHPDGAPPNQRLKLSARGGRLVGNGVFLSAAASARSLSAIG